jgi:hypothetical protein
VFGTMDRVTQVLAACGWQINPGAPRSAQME